MESWRGKGLVPRPYLILSSATLEQLQDMVCAAATYGYRLIGNSLQVHHTEFFRECSVCMYYPGFGEHEGGEVND